MKSTLLKLLVAIIASVLLLSPFAQVQAESEPWKNDDDENNFIEGTIHNVIVLYFQLFEQSWK